MLAAALTVVPEAGPHLTVVQTATACCTPDGRELVVEDGRFRALHVMIVPCAGRASPRPFPRSGRVPVLPQGMMFSGTSRGGI